MVWLDYEYIYRIFYGTHSIGADRNPLHPRIHFTRRKILFVAYPHRIITVYQNFDTMIRKNGICCVSKCDI